ncbi:MAG: zinc-binding dehydrogenase [Planctomycetales bacterium]|nr:zinc-binding dehydrogenase [Planctomycetales bacterium]
MLEVHDVPPPQPAAGQVRVQVRAAGVNFADVLIRVGIYPNAPRLPAVIGYEMAGEIDAVGEGVDPARVGSRVVGLLPHYGGYSEQVILPAADAIPFSDTLSFTQAATLPVNYLTAWLMLVRLGHVQEDQTVLVHAAAGGVGLAAVQICRWRKANVIGTASRAKHERLRELGVRHCIDYRSQDFQPEVLRITGGQGVDLALDAVGGASFAQSYQCLAPLGRLFVYGVSSMVPGPRRSWTAILKSLLQMPKFKPLDLLAKNRGVMGISLGQLGPQGALLGPLLREIVGHAQRGVFDPVVAATFPLTAAAEAHRYLQDRQNVGKVLLVP